MNALDIGLLAIACALVVFGMARGMIRIVLGVAFLVAAFLLATRFHRPLAETLSGTDLPGGVLNLASYGAIFLATMIAGGVATWMLRKAIKIAMLGWADRLAGGALGFGGALVSAALVVLPLVAYVPSGSTLISESILAPYVTVVSDLASDMAPEELSDAYDRQVENLRQDWRRRVPRDDGSI